MNKYIKLILIIFLANTLHSQDNVHTAPDKLWVDGVCEMCKKRIEKIANSTKGVSNADWSIETHFLSFDKNLSLFNREDLIENITNAGHDTKEKSAPENKYEDLPPCCHYREVIDEVEHKLDENKLTGVVYELDDKNNKVPLLGAYILNLNDNIAASTDEDGKFELNLRDEHAKLVVSYIGYKNDTVDVDLHEYNHYEITMSNSVLLDEIHISYEKRSTEISFNSSHKVENIGLKELKKAACCNLSESFETNPSVDVSYTDAVTGSKVIELLGLAGKYVQITKESMPYIRGLSSIYGMAFTPGSWIENIQLIKGTGSVINGYESMTGQINLEFFKPEIRKPFFLNLYANEHLGSEVNVISMKKLSDNAYSGILFNFNNKSGKTDKNNDGFMDEPVGNQVNVVNRWKFYFNDNIEAQLGIMYNRYRQKAGKIERNDLIGNLWTTDLNNDRLEIWTKTGKIFDGNKNRSIGLQLSGTFNNLDSRFGDRGLIANQKSLYANLIYQTDLINAEHTLKTGFSTQYENIEENIFDHQNTTKELTPGVFAEYSFIPNPKFTMVAGMRLDHSNYYGFFVTPRLNLKYSITDRTVFRAAIGRGQRTATLFTENIGLLSSSRKIILNQVNDNKPYGLDAEVVWNFGANFLQEFKLFNRSLVFTMDYYRSLFENQIVLDLENPREAIFYNLIGKSYSNSFQVQLDYSLIKNLDLRLAYRLNDVKTDYSEGLLEKPLVARNRAFVNLAYSTKNKWKFDYTLNWQGKKRLPNTEANPLEYRLDEYSPDFFVSNCQISKEWTNRLEIYLGGENIFNYMQQNPILSSENPYSQYFDATMVWGPIMGRKIYVGMRYDMK